MGSSRFYRTGIHLGSPRSIDAGFITSNLDVDVGFHSFLDLELEDGHVSTLWLPLLPASPVVAGRDRTEAWDSKKETSPKTKSRQAQLLCSIP